MWLVIAAAVLGIAYAIARNFIRDDDEDDEDDEPLPEDSPDSSLVAAKVAAKRVIETDVQRLLRLAEEAAARGEYEEAIHDAYAALLRRLEGDHLIAVDPWKTNGDYIRELRAKPELRNELRAVVREVEQIKFGSAAAEGARYASVRAKVLGIVGRAMLAAALGVGLGSQLSCELDDFDEGPASERGQERERAMALAGLGNGPQGARAIAELLYRQGIESGRRFEPLDQLDTSSGAIVLLEDAEPEAEMWPELLDWVEAGNTLVIANGRELPDELGVDYSVDFHADPALTPGYSHHFIELELRAPLGRIVVTGLGYGSSRTLAERPATGENADQEVNWWYDQGDEPASTPAQNYVVDRRLGDGHVVVFSEPDMFHNASLIVDDNGAFLVNLFIELELEEVAFVLAGSCGCKHIDGGASTEQGEGADNPFESVQNSKLGWLFIQILVFLAVLYAAVGLPFARLREPLRRKRRAFAEHVRTLGQRYAQARASRHVAALYASWALERLRERASGRASRASLHGLAVGLAARTGRDEAELMKLLLMANDLREAPAEGERGSARDLEIMRQLARLLEETGGAR
nr:DUF4350 domain-containing protein [Pseudenhygromyxa sp. WMMC2535]